MKQRAPRRKSFWKFVMLLAIPAIILLGILFHLSQAFLVPLITVLVLIFGVVIFWAWANRNAEGDEWWQDNEASGWRGDI